MSQRLIPTGERSGLQTRIAATESVLLCERMKTCRPFSNSNRRFALPVRKSERIIALATRHLVRAHR